MIDSYHTKDNFYRYDSYKKTEKLEQIVKEFDREETEFLLKTRNYSAQYLFAKQDLIELYNKERKYKSIINDLKAKLTNLLLRMKNSQKIIRQPIYDDNNSRSIDILLEDIKKAENLMKKNSLESLEQLNQKELNECIELETINSQMKANMKLLQQTTIQLLSPRRNSSFISSFEPVFGSHMIDESLAEADEKISFLQDSITRRKNQLKKRKSELKKLERKYEDVRRISEDMYTKKQQKITYLNNTLEENKDLNSKILVIADEIIQMKKDLIDYQNKRYQIERENYTVSRDKIYNEKYKKQIDELHQRVHDKQLEIAENEKVLKRMRENSVQLMNQVTTFESTLQSDEIRIKQLELQVDSFGLKIDKKIDKSKRELSMFTENSTKLNVDQNTYFDELTRLFNGKSPRKSPRKSPTTKSPRKTFSTPKRDNSSPTKTIINIDAPYLSPIIKSPAENHMASPMKFQQTELNSPYRSPRIQSPKYTSPMYLDQLSQAFE